MRNRTMFCILLILLTVLFGGCQRGVRVSGELARLDSLVDDHYDSVLSVLVQLDTKGMEKGEQMYALLLKGKAMNKADSLFTTDSVMKEVCDYFDRHGNSNQRMLAHYVLGCAYRDMGDAPRALRCYQEAVSQADTTRNDCDLSTLMRVHSQMSNIYRKQQLPAYEQTELQICGDLSWKIKDTLSALLFENAFCTLLYTEKKYDECIEKTRRVREQFIKSGFDNYASLACILCVKSYLNMKKYREANEYLCEYEKSCFLTKDTRKIAGGTTPYYICKGNYNLGIGEPDSAITCFRNAMQDMSRLNNETAVYNGFLNAFIELNQRDSIRKYKNLYYEASNNEKNRMLSEACIQVKSLYDYSAQQEIVKRNEEKMLKTKNERLSYLILFAICAAVLIVFSLWHWGTKNKKEKELSELKYVYQMAKNKLEKEKSMMEKLSHDNLLMEKQVSEKQARISSLEAQKKSIEEKLLEKGADYRMVDISETDAVNRFQEYLKSAGRRALFESDWKRLKDTIESAFPNFYSIMNKERTLTGNKYKICLLVKAGFCPSEIELILGLPHGTVSVMRRRLLKEIFNIDGKAVEFDRIIHTI